MSENTKIQTLQNNKMGTMPVGKLLFTMALPLGISMLVPAAYLLSLTGSVDAVWWAFPIAEVASAAATLFFYRRIYKNKVKPLFDK